MQGTLGVTGNETADHLINTDPLALLLGMLLDQQIPISWAFMGPMRLQERLGDLDAAEIAAMDPDRVVEVFVTKPALHRYPAAMAARAQDLCVHIAAEYGGNAGKVWKGSRSAARLAERIQALPGYGPEKSMILMAILAKRFNVTPNGWEEFAGPFADDQPRSVADMDGPEGVARVKAWKKAQRDAGRSKQD